MKTERVSLRAPDFWYGKPTPLGRLASAALTPLGALYDFVGRIKAAFAQPYDPGIPVLCVGNLTAGGTGKTPLAMAIARRLVAQRPYLLTRGYGGKLKGPVLVTADHTAIEVGDEALLLRGAAPTIVARNRRTGALAARNQGAGLLIMDDGFQNFALKKSLSILVVDGARGFGNGRVIPAGPLREGIERGLARAAATVVMGEASEATVAALREFKGAIFHGELTPDTAHLPPGPLVAFAGIGQPEKFFASLRALKREVIDARAFPDHYVFASAEIEELRRRAASAGARLVTTEKDLARLPPMLAAGIAALPVKAVIEEDEHFARFLSRLAPTT